LIFPCDSIYDKGINTDTAAVILQKYVDPKLVLPGVPAIYWDCSRSAANTVGSRLGEENDPVVY